MSFMHSKKLVVQFHVAPVQPYSAIMLSLCHGSQAGSACSYVISDHTAAACPRASSCPSCSHPAQLSPRPDGTRGCPQTAHDPAYLVKHLLAGLPDVTTRVHQMRQSRTTSGSNTAADKWLEMEASKEAYVKARASLPYPTLPHRTIMPAVKSSCMRRSPVAHWLCHPYFQPVVYRQL